MNDFALDEYLTNNPVDTIVSLKFFPCSFESVIAPTPLYLGKYQTNITVNPIVKTVKEINFAPVECFRHFGDFRDFEPYTTIQMYIPFCGTVSIPTAECMGKYVSVKLCIDISTGAATGYVIVSKTGSGGICVATATGTAAIDIPVSGLQSANLSNAIFNATSAWTQTQIANAKVSSGVLAHSEGLLGTMAKGYGGSGISLSGIVSSIRGGPVGAISGLVDMFDPSKAILNGLDREIENAKADYNVTHIELPMRLIGAASPVLASVLETNCRMIIYRPVTDETALTNYADTVGYATIADGVVSDFHGFTVGTIDVSGINATADEKQAIAAAFAGGVYL